MFKSTFLSHEQITALPLEQVKPEYEIAKGHLDSLLDMVQQNSHVLPQISHVIQQAKLSYVLLRLREYPKHFAKIQTAA